MIYPLLFTPVVRTLCETIRNLCRPPTVGGIDGIASRSPLRQSSACVRLQIVCAQTVDLTLVPEVGSDSRTITVQEYVCFVRRRTWRTLVLLNRYHPAPFAERPLSKLFSWSVKALSSMNQLLREAPVLIVNMPRLTFHSLHCQTDSDVASKAYCKEQL